MWYLFSSFTKCLPAVRPRPCTMVFVVVMVCAGWKAQESLFLCKQGRYLGWGSKLWVVWLCYLLLSISLHLCLSFAHAPTTMVLAVTMPCDCWKAMKSPSIYIQARDLCFGSKFWMVWVCGICFSSLTKCLPAVYQRPCTMVSVVCGGNYGLQDTS